MNMYDYNKAIFNNKPALTTEEIAEGKKLLARFFNRNVLKDRHYFMLLCRDINYYTLFRAIHTSEEAGRTFADETIECLNNLGVIKSIDRDDLTKTNIEIWVEIEEKDEEGNATKEQVCMYIFPYDEGVIEI